ncbi:MAG: hypothetical protein RR550_03190 [Rikenellaceae bacterium]
MRKLLISAICLVSVATASAQEKNEKSNFKVTGKPVVTVFANYSAGVGSENKKSGFNLERAYLGYDAKVAKNLSAKVVFDIGTSKLSGSDLERLAYVKNAQITWKLENFTLDFGLVGLKEFDCQEKFWGYRYIFKSFQDENKFGSSADMGIVGTYKFTKWLSADLSITNGEGYKKLNIDNRNRYGVGVTAEPIKGLTVRGYFDNYSHSNGADLKDQQTLALFAGYKHDFFSVGAEYNKQYNQKFKKESNMEGYSAYATGKIAKKFSIFARYDYLDKTGDKSTIIGGIQYEPIKYLRISPNYQSIQKKDYIFVSVEFKL